jgi:hypothetical protein
VARAAAPAPLVVAPEKLLEVCVRGAELGVAVGSASTAPPGTIF